MNCHQFATRVASMLQLDVLVLDLSEEACLFESWMLDSLQAFQLVVAIEALSGVDIPPPEIPYMLTVGDAFDYYLSLAGSLREGGQL